MCAGTCHFLLLGTGFALVCLSGVILWVGWRGYLLESVTALGFYKFAKGRPSDCSYSVDFSELKKEAEGFDEYLEIFERGGWNYVCSVGALHWFCAPKSTMPIYTDSRNLSQKYERMRRLSIWCAALGVLVAVVFFALARRLPYSALLIVFGLGLGLALVMSVGAILNHRLIKRLDNQAKQFQ